MIFTLAPLPGPEMKWLFKDEGKDTKNWYKRAKVIKVPLFAVETPLQELKL